MFNLICRLLSIILCAEWKRCQADAEGYFVKGLAKSTLRSYQSGFNRFERFCQKMGRPSLPISEDTVAAFVASLSKEGVGYASLKVYLSALRFHQINKGKGDPRIADMPRLEYILKGIRRDGVASGPASRKERQPITPQLLRKIFTIWKDWSDLKNAKMLWAAACLAFFAFLRVGEFTSPTTNKFDSDADLSVSDVSVDNSLSPSMVFVHLKRSKTDQLRRGVTIVLGRTNKVPLCPVSALLNYLVARGKAPGPLFIWSSGQFLTRAHFVVEVQKALELSGVDSSDFNGHSFRIGAATTAAAKGFEDSLIRTLGRWESDAYRRYIKIPRQELAHYTIMLTDIS